jgi:DNA-directed RNA polymerase subunit RPC12/RpoP
MKIRSIQCSSCGGPKVRPSTSAYLYCDFCGKYLDWDFHRAVSTDVDRHPGAVYERLAADLGPRAEAARGRGDRPEYERIQRTLFEAHMQGCPSSYSPRIGDPAYRTAMLDYIAAYYALIAFDPELRDLEATMDKATSKLKWKERTPEPGDLPDELRDFRDLLAATAATARCGSGSFWRMFDAFETRTRRCFTRADEEGLFEHYPDEVDETNGMKVSWSIFAQAWLPYLRTRDQVQLLQRTGLAAEYVEVDTSVHLQDRHCGRCGCELPTPEGSRTIVCEACGHKVGVDRPEVPCAHCGGAVSVPRGYSHFPCPYCESELRSMG